jgi:hypothetical protein
VAFAQDLAISPRDTFVGIRLRKQLVLETLRLIALLDEASVIERILRLLIEVPTLRLRRAPPLFGRV